LYRRIELGVSDNKAASKQLCLVRGRNSVLYPTQVEENLVIFVQEPGTVEGGAKRFDTDEPIGGVARQQIVL
jgi:hypothetical protein